MFRDVRIASLWEGTTQIQALDLLGRKILLQVRSPFNLLSISFRPIELPKSPSISLDLPREPLISLECP